MVTATLNGKIEEQCLALVGAKRDAWAKPGILCRQEAIGIYSLCLVRLVLHLWWKVRSFTLVASLASERNARVPCSTLKESDILGQQMVEIAKAIQGEPSLLILDEPTASLTENEANHLFALIERLKTQGLGIIYITHRIQEIRRIADRVTVLRDGHLRRHRRRRRRLRGPPRRADDRAHHRDALPGHCLSARARHAAHGRSDADQWPGAGRFDRGPRRRSGRPGGAGRFRQIGDRPRHLRSGANRPGGRRDRRRDRRPSHPARHARPRRRLRPARSPRRRSRRDAASPREHVPGRARVAHLQPASASCAAAWKGSPCATSRSGSICGP